MNKRTLPLLLVPGALLLLSYQNCSHFDAGTGRFTSTSVGSTLPSGQADGGASPLPLPSPVPGATPMPSPTSTIPGSAYLIWNDEFDNLSLYNAGTNTGNWKGASLNTTESGPGWGAEYDISPADNTYGVTPVTVANGMLNIRVDKAPAALQAKIQGYKYTSGAIRTVNPSFGYGYYEMSAQLPPGSGLWAAFWLLPADGAWPPEIDIMESLGVTPNTVYATAHSSKNFKDAVTYSSGHWQSTGGDVPVGANTTTGFHRYGADFRADFITWYVDGKKVYQSVTPPDLVNRKVYIILDSALGGWNNNDVTAQTVFPADYKVDYVRVYSQMP